MTNPLSIRRLTCVLLLATISICVVFAPVVFGQQVHSTVYGDVRGSITQDSFGSALAPIGDFNLDGQMDFIVGVPEADGGPGYANRGEVVFLWGPHSAAGPAGTLVNTVLASDYEYAVYGSAVALIGDFYSAAGPVVAVGAPGRGVNPIQDHGAVYQHYYLSQGGPLQTEVFAPANPFPNQKFGHSIGACDFNGDGFMDMVVGGKGDDATARSKVYIYFGGTSIDVNPDVEIVSEGAAQSFGEFLAAVGDVDSDGYEDILVSAPGINRAYLVYGMDFTSLPIPHTITVDQLGTFGGVTFNIPGAAAVCGGGDVTGDVVLDVSIQSRESSSINRVYIFEGSFLNVTGVKGTADANATITGPGAFGSKMAMGGDVNNDGNGDMLIATPTNNPSTIFNIGRVTILLGSSGVSGTMSMPYNKESTVSEWHMMPHDMVAFEHFGTDCSFVDDFDGDGLDDLIVGAPGAKNEGNTVGNVTLYAMGGGVFTNESDATEIEYTGVPYSSVQLDYDSDGFQDLFVSMQGTDRGQLFRRLNGGVNGAPEMQNRTSNDLPGNQAEEGQRGLSVADYDNDGDKDLFVANSTEPRLYQNTGGQFVDATSDLGLNAQGSLARESWAGTWCDYNRDGMLDLLISRASGSDDPSQITGEAIRLLENRGTYNESMFKDVTAAVGLGAVVSASVSAAWADIDSDHDQDLVLGSLADGGSVRVFRNDFDSGTRVLSFTDVTAATIGTISNVSGVSFVDLRSDTMTDLVLTRRASATGPKLLLLENNSGVFSDVSLDFGVSEDSDLNAVASADFNLDGFPDLLCLPADAPIPIDLELLQNDGTKMKPNSIVAGLGLSRGVANGAAIADFNRDGDLDIFMGRAAATSGTNKFFYQNRSSFFNDNPDDEMNWLTVKLECGDANNRMGIGAKVAFYHPAGGMAQSYIIDGGSGRGGQASSEVVFGFGDTSADGTLLVYWPDGNVTAKSILAIDQNNEQPLVIRDSHVGVSIHEELTISVVALVGEEVEWVFEWMTEYATPAFNDVITVSSKGCPDLPSTITIGNVDEAHVYFDESRDGFVHRYRLIAPCSPCSYNITAESAAEIWDESANGGLGDWVVESAQTITKKVTVFACFE